jgi:hypothetical protein
MGFGGKVAREPAGGARKWGEQSIGTLGQSGSWADTQVFVWQTFHYAVALTSSVTPGCHVLDFW